MQYESVASRVSRHFETKERLFKATGVMALGPDLADDEDEAEFLHIVFEDSSEIPRNR